MEIATLTGLSYPTVRNASDLFVADGCSAVKSAARGRSASDVQLLSAEQEYPAIERRAKTEGGEIHWGDETALVNTDVRGRSYAPRGKTPVAMAVGARARSSR
jgi:hypothetical protein